MLALVPGGARGDLSGPGQRWPGSTITYEDRLVGSDGWALARAVEAWNESGVAVGFRRAPGLADPGLLITYAPPRSPGLGRAQVGYVPFRTAFLRLRRPAERDPRQDRFVMAAVIAHELGHVLGLRHAPPCNVMAADLGPWIGATGGCRTAPKRHWRCGLLSRDDVASAVQLYGGLVRPPHVPRWCRR